MPILTAALALFLLPLSALAHPGHGGLEAGLLHPLFGLDHLLVALSVGLWAARAGAIRLFPCAFLAGTAVGAALGYFGYSFPFVELGIGVSLASFGLLLPASRRIPLLPGALLLALFGSFHGLAHGSEMPHEAQVLPFFLGFLTSTALLHLTGIKAMLWMKNRLQPRVVDWAVAACGLCCLVGLGWMV
jgi:urease accessory protein